MSDRLRLGSMIALAAAVVGGCDREPARDRAAPAGDRGRERGQEMVRSAADCHAAELPAAAVPCRRACDLGHSNSCARLGSALLAAGDRDGARHTLELACRGGSGVGCEAAAELAIDPGAASRWERDARTYHRVHCEQGYAASCVGLAGMFQRGRGGPADPAVAAHYRRRACSLGARAACDLPAGQ